MELLDDGEAALFYQLKKKKDGQLYATSDFVEADDFGLLLQHNAENITQAGDHILGGEFPLLPTMGYWQAAQKNAEALGVEAIGGAFFAKIAPERRRIADFKGDVDALLAGQVPPEIFKYRGLFVAEPDYLDSFPVKGALPALEFSGRRGPIKVRGKIDRLDRQDPNGVFGTIIDYKSNGKQFDWAQAFDGLQMQLLTPDDLLDLVSQAMTAELSLPVYQLLATNGKMRAVRDHLAKISRQLMLNLQQAARANGSYPQAVEQLF
ncbi:hypothetical protein GQS40_08730|uniref:PD-(D/E)XK endonuclease-like domain-containing protein n=1 Tax=Leuconostoc lactis TaxID=1246 RepID=A0A6L7AAI2_LEULA|nr:hypothetical protein [Leuconostoc lactis]